MPGATHLFEEPGALEQVADLAADWFMRHLQPARSPGLTLEDPHEPSSLRDDSLLEGLRQHLRALPSAAAEEPLLAQLSATRGSPCSARRRTARTSSTPSAPVITRG